MKWKILKLNKVKHYSLSWNITDYIQSKCKVVYTKQKYWIMNIWKKYQLFHTKIMQICGIDLLFFLFITALLTFNIISILVQVHNIANFHLYILWSDHHDKFIHHEIPHKFIIILLITFSILYIISQWLIYFTIGIFYVLISFIFFTQSSKHPLHCQPSIHSQYLSTHFSCVP